MSSSNSAASMDPLAFPAKAPWEDPAITLERRLDARAQTGPPTGGPPTMGADYGFLGPLGLSPGAGGLC